MSKIPFDDLGLAPIDDGHARKRETPSHSSKAKNCSECRRLKVKCDRAIPCLNCIKRGCASICPDGSLVSKGNRLVLANTQDLHDKIEQLSSRVRELESALASSHEKQNDEPHPLLHKDLLLTGTLRKEQEDPYDIPVESFGSLMIGEDGTSKFYGVTSGVEFTIPFDDDDPAKGYNCAPASVMTYQDSVSSKHERDFNIINGMFPSAIDSSVMDKASLMEAILLELPSKDDALTLINMYYKSVAWIANPVPRAQLINDHFVPCYGNGPNPSVSKHTLALLFTIFALAVSINFEQSPDQNLGHRYISLSRACLALECMHVNTSVTSIEAMILQIMYMQASQDVGGASKAWAALGTTIKLAQSIGLHREPSKWNLSEYEVTRRRRTMWELVSTDLWTSLSVGRPPGISKQHMDVQFPMDTSDSLEGHPNFYRGKHLFTKECLWPVLDHALSSANPTTYSVILKLDKKIRDWMMPLNMQISNIITPGDHHIALSFQRTLIFTIREITLLSLHRAYFAHALMEPPFDPLRSRYSRSVLAAYGSACAILGRVRTLQIDQPKLMTRFNIFWTHSFSAAVTLASIVIRAPDCPLATTALLEFNHCVDMYQRAKESFRPGRLLPPLLDLQEKAMSAANQFQNGTWTRPSGAHEESLPGMSGNKPVVQHTRKKTPSSYASSPNVSDSGIDLTSLENVQPTLDDYLNSFNIGATAGVPTEQGPIPVLSSDAFLQGALTGNWNFMSTHSNSWKGEAAFEGMTYAPPIPKNDFDPIQVDAPQSSYSNPSPFAPEFMNQSTMFEPSPNSLSESVTSSNEGAPFLWDKFLADLGLPQTSSTQFV